MNMRTTLFMKMNTAQKALTFLLLSAIATMMAGCGSSSAQKRNRDFFTSGSREADQRASQRMAADEQLTGNGEGAGEKGVKEAVVASAAGSGSASNSTNKAAQSAEKLALYDRLGAENGVSNIVADFLPRALQDPRVNWQRKDVTRGGFSIHRGQSVTWSDTPNNVRQLATHFTQFICLAAGGPAHYDGKEMKSTHAQMHISNAEFDATVGDLKASLDRLKIPNKEQKELLAIVESTRTEIVTER
jgi:hemoglobin